MPIRRRWLAVVAAVSLAVVPVTHGGPLPCTSSLILLQWIAKNNPPTWNGSTWVFTYVWKLWFACSDGPVQQCQVCSYVRLDQMLPSGVWWPLSSAASPEAIGSCGNQFANQQYTTVVPDTGVLLPNTTYRLVFLVSPYNPNWGACMFQGQQWMIISTAEFTTSANP